MQTVPDQRSSSHSRLRNEMLLVLPLMECSLFFRCAALSVGHGKVVTSLQDSPGLCLDHSRAAQSTVTVNIAVSALIKATEMCKISLHSTFLLPRLRERLQRKYLEALGLELLMECQPTHSTWRSSNLLRVMKYTSLTKQPSQARCSI